MIEEIAIISGKGGTGKTTLTLSLIPYFESLVIADCDVDAPDLKILLTEDYKEKVPFFGLQRPVIDEEKCIHCGLCHQKCKFGAISEDIVVQNNKCEGCKVCEFVCPAGAITMKDFAIGDLYIRDTSYGPMVDARLIPGEESSGKLVAEVRKQAKNLAVKHKKDTILIDGSPGIACNVISTISGVTKAVIVTEPTQSGLHDLKRVLKLSKMFSVNVKVVINKYTINTEMSTLIEQYCAKENVDVILRIPFDKQIVESITEKKIPCGCNIPFFESKEWLNFVTFMQQREVEEN